MKVKKSQLIALFEGLEFKSASHWDIVRFRKLILTLDTIFLDKVSRNKLSKSKELSVLANDLMACVKIEGIQAIEIIEDTKQSNEEQTP